MLVRFTIEGGCIPVTEQARQDLQNTYLGLLRDMTPARKIEYATKSGNI